MMHDNRGRVGDVARSLGGILVTPPVDPENITIASGGVPVIAPPSQADLGSSLRYGNHRSEKEHPPLIWEKSGKTCAGKNAS